MVSVRGNRIILRAKRLNKEVVPRLTNAHNYSYNALPVYHFLADLQTQGLRGGLGFNWGTLANEYNFLPRVVYKNIIFSPATWNIKLDDIKGLLKVKEDRQLVETLQKWRKEKNMPPQVLLADSDNKLFINLNNSLCIKTLFSVTKNRRSFQLVEFLFNSDHAVVKSKKGVFTNEFIFSFHKIKKPSQQNELKKAQI